MTLRDLLEKMNVGNVCIDVSKEIKLSKDIVIHARTHVFESGLVDNAKNDELVKAFMDYEIKEVASYTKLAVPGDRGRSVIWLTLKNKED